MFLRTIILTTTMLVAALATPGVGGLEVPCTPADTGCVTLTESRQPDAPAQTIFEDFRIQKTFPKFELADTNPGAKTWVFRSAGPSLQLFRSDESLAVFTAYDAAGPIPSVIMARRTGFREAVGIGTDAPTSRLHVIGTGAPTEPVVTVEAQGTQVIGRNLLRLSNNGPATFRFENRAVIAQPGGIWSFGARVLGNQFFIASNGAPTLNLTLDPNGNMTIAGALTQMSDRASKHAVEPVDADEWLKRVVALPVSTWIYNGDQARHVGPMAQDFAAAFGLGSDDKHVAPSDVAGVGLAGLQALARQLARQQEQTDARLAALELALSEKQAELAALRGGSTVERGERP